MDRLPFSPVVLALWRQPGFCQTFALVENPDERQASLPRIGLVPRRSVHDECRFPVHAFGDPQTDPIFAGERHSRRSAFPCGQHQRINYPGRAGQFTDRLIPLPGVHPGDGMERYPRPSAAPASGTFDRVRKPPPALEPACTPGTAGFSPLFLRVPPPGKRPA